jgi:rubrerythrin
MFVFGTADDVFGMAVRIEENGKAFYSGAAAKASDARLKSLFEDLAQMEAGHIGQFKEMRSRLASSIDAAGPWDPEGLAESYLQATADTHVFTGESAGERLKGVNTPHAALDMALMFEKDSLAFFIGMKQILPDASGKAEIDALIEAEMDHVRMLSAARKSLA